MTDPPIDFAAVATEFGLSLVDYNKPVRGKYYGDKRCQGGWVWLLDSTGKQLTTAVILDRLRGVILKSLSMLPAQETSGPVSIGFEFQEYGNPQVDPNGGKNLRYCIGELACCVIPTP